jgi:hypothetical protein
MEIEVGRIIRSSTTRFAVGCRVLQPHVPAFGSLVKVPVLRDQVYGLIHDVHMEDDPYVRQVAMLYEATPEIIADQRSNRQVPIEVEVLVVGYRREEQIVHWVPPQPPLSLDLLRTCTAEELVAFTERFDYFRLVLDKRDLPADELLAANLRYAALLRAGQQGVTLLDAAASWLRLLAMDLPRQTACCGGYDRERRVQRTGRVFHAGAAKPGAAASARRPAHCRRRQPQRGAARQAGPPRRGRGYGRRPLPGGPRPNGPALFQHHYRRGPGRYEPGHRKDAARQF